MSEPNIASLEALKKRIGYGECLKCGACCRHLWLLVEAGPVDVLREPMIAHRCRVLDGNGTVEDPLKWRWNLTVTKACPFLSPDDTCDIYATRPDDCVAFEPGGKKCRQCRKDAGMRAPRKDATQ
jgi:Fe-S-cluster containining protein